MLICERCYQDESVGEHGVNLCPMEPRRASAVIGDDIPGGMWFENGFKTPQKFYSHSEHRAALAAEGKEINAKWAGPHDKIMSRWDAGVDLASAEAFVKRYYDADRAEATHAAEEFPITVTDVTYEEPR